MEDLSDSIFDDINDIQTLKNKRNEIEPVLNEVKKYFKKKKIILYDFSLKEVKKRVLEFAKILGIEHCLEKYPYQISGGEQQRVNIIRATSLKPDILLCDEPTGNLDSKNSDKVVSLLKDISKQLGTTLLVVTHDVAVANSFDQKITIEDGQIIG